MRFDVKDVSEVFDILRRHFSDYKLEEEVVSIDEACGRITCGDVTAKENVPGFHRSLVDGYAVIASDTFGAGDAMPAQLELVGEVSMGIQPEHIIRTGQAAYIPTGGELPVGADSVVMMEHSEDLHDGYIYLYKAAAPGNHLIFRGDDAKKGEVVLPSGIRLKAQDIGVLAALGYDKVAVKRKLKVGLISTGDELVAVKDMPTASQIRDVNTHSLYSALLQDGAAPLRFGIVKDQYETLRKVAKQALVQCDILLISGGSSMGERDETLKVIASMEDSVVLVHGIAVKPGKPTIISKVGGKPVIGLPGHPVSAFMIYSVFIQDLIRRMAGLAEQPLHPIKARMVTNYPSNHGREEFLPVTLEYQESSCLAQPVLGKSGLITMLTKADGYVTIHRNSEGLTEGQWVTVRLF